MGELRVVRVERTAGAFVQLSGAGGVTSPFEHRPQREFVAVPGDEPDTGQRRAVRPGLLVQPAGEVLGQPAGFGQADRGAVQIG